MLLYGWLIARKRFFARSRLLEKRKLNCCSKANFCSIAIARKAKAFARKRDRDCSKGESVCSKAIFCSIAIARKRSSIFLIAARKRARKAKAFARKRLFARSRFEKRKRSTARKKRKRSSIFLLESVCSKAIFCSIAICSKSEKVTRSSKARKKIVDEWYFRSKCHNNPLFFLFMTYLHA